MWLLPRFPRILLVSPSLFHPVTTPYVFYLGSPDSYPSPLVSASLFPQITTFFPMYFTLVFYIFLPSPNICYSSSIDYLPDVCYSGPVRVPPLVSVTEEPSRLTPVHYTDASWHPAPVVSCSPRALSSRSIHPSENQFLSLNPSTLPFPRLIVGSKKTHHLLALKKKTDQNINSFDIALTVGFL